MSDPAEFADAEIIKAKLEKVLEQLDRIEGRLEALMAAIEDKGRKKASRG